METNTTLFFHVGCHNDVANIKKYLIQHQGFPESDMLILVDDNRSHSPTRRNIEDAFARICQYSQDGDVVFVHYSGTYRIVWDSCCLLVSC
jgi:metacaspase-1